MEHSTLPLLGEVGYYGLVLLPGDAEFIPLREYGSAVLLAAKVRTPDPSSPLGLVHVDVEDPYLRATWIKTLTDPHFSSPSQWHEEMEYHRRYERIEIPLAIGGPWKCDNTKPISREDLERLREYLMTLFSANPSVPVWELGVRGELSLEEE